MKKRIRILLAVVICIVCILFEFSCKKKESQAVTVSASNNNSLGNPYYQCNLYSTPGGDTSYIPHSLGNTWNYCSGNQNLADWSCKITLDTVINGRVVIRQSYHTNSQHIFPTDYDDQVFIDALGNYHCLFGLSLSQDTMLIINPSANNGDTIFKNPVSGRFVKLIDKNATFTYKNFSVSGCYRIVCSSYSPPYTSEIYFKKGIGALNDKAYVLSNATLH